MICNLNGKSGSGGSVSGNTFRKVQGTYAVRRYTRGVFKDSSEQQQNIAILKEAAYLWSNVLTAGQQAAWNAFYIGKAWPWGLLPNTKITGYAWFTRAAILLEYYQFGVIGTSDPSTWPGIPSLAIAPGAYISYSAVGGVPTLVCTITTDANPAAANYTTAFGWFGRQQYPTETPENPSKIRWIGTTGQQILPFTPGVPFPITINADVGTPYTIGMSTYVGVVFNFDELLSYMVNLTVQVLP